MKKSIGFYLHTSWEFNYPFAVRSWNRDDFQKFFALLQAFGFNRVMYWPLTETMPAPLSADDRRELEAMRCYTDDAHARGLELWLTFCPNASVRGEIAVKPFKQRHFYPFKVEARLDDPVAGEAYFRHRAEILEVLNNADGYVTIDGDPGGYPGARPETYVEVFRRDRELLNRVGTHPETQKVVPWLWSGWGSNWEENGVWNEPIEPLTAPVLELLKANWSSLEPIELMPGRSIRDGHANGRVNFALAEAAGLIPQSTLLTYEIIEYEPTPPAAVIQFDDIRRVLRQEWALLEKSHGVMGNAQQPVMALPNLWLFARGAQDPAYLDRSDLEILQDLSDFLGGDATILIPAWQCLQRDLNTLPADLPQALRASQLRSPEAQGVPGGPQQYLEILAEFVAARIGTLRAAELAGQDAVQAIVDGIAALVSWWKVHRYVLTGEYGEGFRLVYSHELLAAPVQAMLSQYSHAKRDACSRLVGEGILSEVEAANL